MRAQTRKKHEIRKRFAIVIGVAAAGVMALGAQTAAQTPAPTPPPPTCKGLAATIVGTEGNDNPLNGTPGRDVIVGLGGGDGIVAGGPGNDVICGGSGKDTLYGGPGKDTLLGQAGSDTLTGGEGKDTLLGQAGSDLFTFGQTRKPGDGKDRCKGGKGIDFTFPVCEVEKSIEKSGTVR
jgi:Ca2+-binding RTX toxin-like protein